MNDSQSPRQPSQIVTWGARLTGFGLILLGLHVFLPELAAWGYGVEPLDDNGKAYLIAAGTRDLSLGLMTLYLLKNHRASLGMFFLFMMIVPVADILIVLQHGSTTWKILPHAVGFVAISVITILAFREL